MFLNSLRMPALLLRLIVPGMRGAASLTVTSKEPRIELRLERGTRR
jgi:hypothetical protein